MKHLVTGGAGFVGSALARRLVHDGHDVTVLDRFSRGKQDRVPLGARTVACDIRSRDQVVYCVGQADVVWHLAYVQGTQTFYAEPKTVIDVALRGIMNVLDGCDAATVKPTLILVSSSEAYQVPPPEMFPTNERVPLSVPDVTNPRYSYGGGKIASEIATLAYAQAGATDRAVIVRPHNVYGPDMGEDHVIPQFTRRVEAMNPRGNSFVIQGTGWETRSFCYIDDCVDGLLTLLDAGRDREVYHLGNPLEEVTIRDLAHRVAGWHRRDIKVVPSERLKGSPTRRLPDIGKLAGIGFRPSVNLDVGLDRTLRWYTDHPAPAEPVAA